ncbi:hypothetical protein F5050DRAFT_1810524 [Lentinula boryana]|uniref:Uncharacterized protein n=1 Tax=Lentinula boryana TaxID=40481 RepID=A0ABQ8Q4Q4_9AGAR|nr:hypothetical protein F5050DRAFT_1810524 [Lentinula boryana]
MSQITNSANDPSGSNVIQFGEFNDSSNTQNAPIGADSTAGMPAFNNVSGPGFPGPFGGGSHLPPAHNQNTPFGVTLNAGVPPANNQNTPFGVTSNAGAPAFPTMTGPGFTGPSGGGSHSGFFHNNNPQFGTTPNFSSPFNGLNNYAAPGMNYPFNQQMQITNPAFTNYGYTMPMMSTQGMHSSTAPTTPLRVTVGNLITHADNCPMCMGYVAHLITASDFNEIISEQDGLIQGATVSHNNSQDHELVVSSLQEQLASTSRSHETERQTLADRITALELERNELRARHESDVAQIDDIIRDCQEANERCLYWKDQYYNLRNHGDCQDSSTRAVASDTKSVDKGKGREVPMVPLQNRITSVGGNVTSGSSVPLSQRLSPMEGENIPQQESGDNGAAKATTTPVRVEEAPVKAGVSTATITTPHMGEKQKRDVVGSSSAQHALVSYDNLHTDNSKEPTYSYKAYQMEHYLTDMEDDYSEPEAHPNRLKGKQREWQNKINRESRRNMDAQAAQRAREEGRSPPPNGARAARIKNMMFSEEWLPNYHSKPQSRSKRSREWLRLLTSQIMPNLGAQCGRQCMDAGHPLPHLFEPKPSLKKAKGFTMRDVMPGEAGPSNADSTSYGTESRATAVAPTTAKGSRIRRSPTILENRVWHGCRENNPVSKWAEAILSSPASERLNGMLVESNQNTPVTNTRSIRGMVAVFQLLPNNSGNDVLSDNDSNLIVHALLCKLALHPTRYDGILHSMGLLPHPHFQPGPLPDYNYTSPPTVRQIAHELAIRGYNKSHLQDIALYLLWWLHGIAPTMTSCWTIIQQQFIHVVLEVLAHHVFQGVPRSTVDVENYIFTNGSQSSNIDNAGRYADYSVVLTHVRPFAQQLAAQSSTTHVATGEQPTTALTVDDHTIEMAPGIIDWDDTQFNATGDPVIDYGEDDGMDMAGYTQPHE